MQNVYRLVTRAVTIAPSGTETVTLESGTPYRHYIVWVHKIGPNVSAQPYFGGEADGSAININSNGATKVFQSPVDEIRPPTNPSDPNADFPPFPMKSSVTFTNSSATTPVNLTIYMMASASPGGA